MNGVLDISAISTILVGTLLIAGAAITLIGSLGLLRLDSFYKRAHAPTLGTTLGTGCVALACILHFSVQGNRFVMPELLIITFIFITTPISLMVLVRASVLRDKIEKDVTQAIREID